MFVFHVSEPLGDIQRPRAVSWSKCAKERAQELRAGDLDWISGTSRLFEHCWEQNHEYRTKSGSWCWNKKGANPLPHPKAQSRKASLGASRGLLQKCPVLTNVGCFSSTQHLFWAACRADAQTPFSISLSSIEGTRKGGAGVLEICEDPLTTPESGSRISGARL